MYGYTGGSRDLRATGPFTIKQCNRVADAWSVVCGPGVWVPPLSSQGTPNEREIETLPGRRRFSPRLFYPLCPSAHHWHYVLLPLALTTSTSPTASSFAMLQFLPPLLGRFHRVLLPLHPLFFLSPGAAFRPSNLRVSSARLILSFSDF